jgi:uncharacterized protein YndB with AHSA1/START domain
MKFNPETDLLLERIVDVPRSEIWKAWTNPELLKEWFCPKPWKVTECKLDLRPGGEFYTKMQGPEGQEHPMTGCYLEIVPEKKLVFTDCLLADFKPSQNPFMTAMVVLEDHGKGTKYSAYAFHKDNAVLKQHQTMGFEQGWGIALDQMVEMIKKKL